MQYDVLEEPDISVEKVRFLSASRAPVTVNYLKAYYYAPGTTLSIVLQLNEIENDRCIK